MSLPSYYIEALKAGERLAENLEWLEIFTGENQTSSDRIKDHEIIISALAKAESL